MGTVYEVEHVQLGTRHALKLFSAEQCRTGSLKDRFLVEGKALAILEHPNVVHVTDLDYDESSGSPYYVMDLVLASDGQMLTLGDVDTDTLHENEIRGWFRELSAALDYIHSKGIVHRDIKLRNILLDSGRHAVLTDFGISKFLTSDMSHRVNAVQTIATEIANASKLLMGTRGYIAPEVLHGHEATAAADAYSLGVLIFYLLTGVWYERGTKALKMLDTYDYSWAYVLPRLLDEDPSKRPENLTAVADRLDSNSRIVESSESSKDGLLSQLSTLKSTLWWMSAAVVVVGLGMWFWFIFPMGAAQSQSANLDRAFSANGIFEVSR